MTNIVKISPLDSTQQLGFLGGGRGGNACAACKYQRRRCTLDCPLAPYFPVERHKEFLNAHKLFGVSNILRVLKNVIPSQSDNAMKALIFEANIRAADPVGGCYRIIMNLYRQINLYQTELQFVYNEILRAQAVYIQQHRNNINTKACSVPGISNSTVSSEVESSNQFKGEVVDHEIENKITMSSSKDKQSFVEHQDLKPYFGNFYDCRGKGIPTELSNDKVVSKTRVN